MRVLQLIDSLNPGGAERMAVNIANALSRLDMESYLCTTREEGRLKLELEEGVSYIFLQKLRTLDFLALLKLRRFIKNHGITHIHAHTTSYFFATLLKLSTPKLVVIWHEHHGSRIATKRRDNLTLYFCSIFFSGIIAVNKELQEWCHRNLAVRKVIYLPNFVPTFLIEEIQEREKIIICLANLRTPKNHRLLLKAFSMVHIKHPEWKLKFLGTDFKGSYSEDLQNIIINRELQSSVIFAGNNKLVHNELTGAAIGVLSSDSEGLPMAILEYGATGLAVVCTDVGQCKDVVSNFGKIVPPKNAEALAEALLFYIEDEKNRMADALVFSTHISENYAEAAIIPKLLNIYKESDR